MPEPKPDSDPAARQPKGPHALQQLSLAMMIPMLLLAGPLVGYAMGYALRRWLGWPEWVVYLLVILGLISGVRETITVIKRISK